MKTETAIKKDWEVSVSEDGDIIETKLTRSKKSQNSLILAYLQKGYSLNPLQALAMFGCFRLGARIYDLKKQGYKIETFKGWNMERDKFFAVYSLKS